MRDDIPDVLTLLARVRARPGQWMPQPSTVSLWMLLNGVRLAEDWHAVPTHARLGGFDFDGFESWVERVHNPERLTALSFTLAAIAAGSDRSGFDLWFHWYDDYNRLHADPPPQRTGDAGG